MSSRRAAEKQREDKKEEQQQQTETSRVAAATTAQEFRDWYVNQVTGSFGQEIEQLRKQQEEVTAGGVADLNVLVSILRTGESNAVFDSLAKSAIVDSFKQQQQQQKPSKNKKKRPAAAAVADDKKKVAVASS